MATLSRWDPFAEMNRLQDQLFQRAVNRDESYRPPVDIHEDDKGFTLDVEIPGLSPDEVTVDVEKGVLTIRGERKLRKEEDRDGYRRVERYYGSFSRSFALPETVDADAIEAKADQGVLSLRLPKRPAPGARRIEIR
ncbi:MAG: Hsp20/alpha crystallin family protein [Deltaproteobacteria bacterium]|nr:MAG: Hsp20/alpha crystallin family protein [Deltaproteobacteria bacterium]